MADLAEFVSVPGSDDEEASSPPPEVADADGGDDFDESEDVEPGGEASAPTQRNRHPRARASLNFMRVRFEGSIPRDILGLELVVLQSLRTLYGQAGAADSIEILKYDVLSREAHLTVASQASTQVRNAFTVLSEWERAPMRARVIESAPHVASRIGRKRARP